MLGAIVGDIVGSVYEFHNIKSKSFPLFRKDCHFTDDTVMTLAVADAIMDGGERIHFIVSMKMYGRMYPDAGYGGRFRRWLFSEDKGAYNSFGNGSAMRVSPCAWIRAPGEETSKDFASSKACELAIQSAVVTHSHPEGVKGAVATAHAIWLCRQFHAGAFKDDENIKDIHDMKQVIRQQIEETYGYDLSHCLNDIRPHYEFNETCQGSVPQAIRAFIESRDFEDAIRNAISIGGDSDTIAAITGSIAEAAYGIPEAIEKKALSYLGSPLLDIVHRWKRFDCVMAKGAQ